MPLPMAPAFTPNAARLLEMSLPQLAPTQGVTYPSARACEGSAISAAVAAAKTTPLNLPPITRSLLPPHSARDANSCRAQSGDSDGTIASDVPRETQAF